ncbi:MAG: rhombosortase [Litorilituus sp.]|nr:rhombosortase [Litorilituus sp.]
MNYSALPLSRQHVSILVLVILLAILSFALDYTCGNSFTHLFVYQRELISTGEIWRLFSGHFLHTNFYHLLLNLAALVLLWCLHGRFYQRASFITLFILCSLTTSLGMYYFSPNLQQYVGLSGVLHGIFIFGAIMDIYAKEKTGYLLFIGVWLKIAHEQIYGASTDVSNLIEANVAVDAHLWGALGGLLFTLSYLVYLYNIKKSQ